MEKTLVIELSTVNRYKQFEDQYQVCVDISILY